MPIKINTNNIEISQQGPGLNRGSIYYEIYKIYLGAAAYYPVLRTLLLSTDGQGYLYGDVDHSGSITLTDVLRALDWNLNKPLDPAIQARMDAIAAIMTNDSATYQQDNSYWPDPVIFSTNYKMPHIVSSVSGTFTTPTSTITLAGGQVVIQSAENVYIDSSSNYTEANSFCWAYIKPIVGGGKTDIDVGSPIFLTGTINLRLYLQAAGYRGGILITPRAWDGYIGFRYEHTYLYTGTYPPAGLDPDIPGTTSSPGIQLAYTIYYGRFA